MRLILAGNNGVLPYLEGLARNNKYRTYSDAAFGKPNTSCLKSFRIVNGDGDVCKIPYEVLDSHTIWNSQTEVGTREVVKNKFAVVLTCEHSQSLPGSDASGASGAECTQMKYSLDLPDGTKVVRRVKYATCPATPETSCGPGLYDGSFEELFQIHKDWAYRQAILTAYGPIRSLMDVWYARVGQSPPVFALDSDLETAVMKPMCKQLDLGPDAPPCVDQGGDAELKQLILTSRDGGTVGRPDQRRVANYVAKYGWRALTQLRGSAYVNDPLAPDGPALAEYLGVIRDAREPSQYQRIFAGLFAAKFVSLP